VVAVVLLFVVGAMAALSIDVVTFYTARSEAQLSADAGALAGARVLANSGMTSDPGAVTDGLRDSAETLAKTIAAQVAASNNVGGRTLVPGSREIYVTFNDTYLTNPQVTVQTMRTDIPTFFARIWGNATVKVEAHATAEAYNSSGANNVPGATVIPVAPTCVKPWVLPNMSPNGGAIIRADGSIADTNLVGTDLSTTYPLQAVCASAPGGCGSGTWWGNTNPVKWQYFPGDPTSTFSVTGPLQACASSFNEMQESIAGCVETPISCGSNVTLEQTHSNLRSQTANAVNCLIQASTSTNGDTVASGVGPSSGAPFRFVAGADNPLVAAGSIAAGTDVMVSNSIVTLPIYDDGKLGNPPAASVPVVGFVQLFLSPNGAAIDDAGPNRGQMGTMVLNIAGCGTNNIGSTVQPILGNGSSPVAVRLVSSPAS
jgi:hypothetical protein